MTKLRSFRAVRARRTSVPESSVPHILRELFFTLSLFMWI